jgi:magnesium-transporting ATPase (P-type)
MARHLRLPNENPEIAALQAKPYAIAKLGSAAGPLLFIVFSVKFLVGLPKQSLFVDTIIVVVVPKACEVMGNALTIYSDKTDALTQNQMQAVSRIIRTSLQLEGLQHGESTGASTSMDTIDDTSISKPAEMLDNPFKDLLLKSVTLNSAALVGEVGSGKAFIDFGGD